MGDLKVNEAFTDAVRITNSTGVAVTGLTPTCTSVKIADNTRTALVVAELGSGWYTAPFTPNAAGSWATEWAVAGAYTIAYPFKLFKVGGGQVDDINTALTFQHQAQATLIQAAPAQNTWYTILDTTVNVCLYAMDIWVQTTGETIEVKLTIDGLTLTGSQAAVADTNYYWSVFDGIINAATSLYSTAGRYHAIEGRSVKLEARKTTNNGVGNLRAKVEWAKR